MLHKQHLVAQMLKPWGQNVCLRTLWPRPWTLKGQGIMEPGFLSFWNMLRHGYWCTYVSTDIHSRSLFNWSLCLGVIYWHNWAKHNISQLFGLLNFGLGLDLSLKCLASDSGAFGLVYNLCLAVFLCQSSCLTHADGDNHILLMYKLHDDIANSSRLITFTNRHSSKQYMRCTTAPQMVITLL